MLRDETVRRALHEISKGDAQRLYFFDRLNSPAWLAPLSQAGYFSKPPAPQRDDQHISFPLWEQSRYLARMAKTAEVQQAVMDLALAIPDTDNVRIHEDLLDIALALPPEMAARFVPQAKNWVLSPYKLLLPDKIGDLIVHLAIGGQAEAALELAGAALALQPDLRAAEKGEEELFLPEPQPLFEKWYYQRILDKTVPVLAQARGLETVRLLADLLNSAIELSRKKEEDGTGGEDYLFVWHSAIEQGKDLDHLPSALICASRDAAEQVIRGDPALFRVVVDDLKARKWISFRRLVLHLCSVFEETGLEEAAAQFENPRVLDIASTRHEVVLLLKKVFARLPEAIRAGVLEWIERGPDREGLRSQLGDKASEMNVDDFCDGWRRDWLAVLEGQLPESWTARLIALVSRLGPPRPLEAVDRGGTWVGPTSPRPAEDFTKMSPSEVVEYLKSWQPPGGPTDPTPEGLGRTLTGVIAAAASGYACHAAAFRDVDPTYVRSLFHGLKEALKQRVAFDWKSVLELASWVISQPREIPGRTAPLMDSDPNWGWTRNAIADLLTEGFGDVPGALPFVERDRVWAVLRPITDDPDPTPDHEKKYGGKNMDPATMSINTVRGDAFHAAMHYALWVRRSLDAGVPEDARLPRSFGVIPEIREVLDAHLDVTNEPSLAIHSIYGRWLPYIAGLDWDWTCANLPQIFPTEETETLRFRAAWESFVVFNRPNTALLPVLLSCYQHAVQQLDPVEKQMDHPANPDDRLGEHLVIYYWLDKIQIEGNDGLIRAFFARASDRSRAHLIWFVGRSVSQWEEMVPAAVYDRLRALFEYRLAAARSAPTTAAFEKELANWGSWFVSGKFDERWCLDTLLSVLKLVGKVEFERDVTKRLSELCPRFPLDCVTALRGMIDGSKETWIILALGDEVQQLLEAALHSGDPDAVFAARRLTEDLIARRHFDFRKLLN